MFGVNLSGAEFGRNRGTYGTDYTYPTAAELDYYHGHGIDLIRLPFTWERMQPVLGGPLDPAELARMVGFLDAAAARGMNVILDLHNYGRYDGQVIGSQAVPIAAFQQFWTELAGELAGHPAVWGFGLMNEPHDMGSASIWPAAAQAAVDGIRSTGSRETIIVAGDGWSSAGSWQQVNGNLHVRDPLDNVLYEAHVYFDHANQGVYAGSYDAEGAYPTIGLDRVQPFLDWLADNNLRGFIGEYAVPDSDPRWLTVLDIFLYGLDQANIPSTYWGGGPWWGSYSLAIEPRNGIDRPQMDVLERYTGYAPRTALNSTDRLGSSGDDVLTATAKTGVLFGYEGNDVLKGSSTGDTLLGGVGDDRLKGGAERDYLYGQHGNDRLDGGDGNDVLRGGEGHDVLAGGYGDDELRGDAGGDTINGNAGNDVIDGGTGDDRLYGDAGNDKINGGDGNDVIGGNDGNDQVFGGTGNDTLSGDGGSDWIEGGTGNDLLWGGAFADRFAFAADPGTDTIRDFRPAEGDRLVLNGQQYVLNDTPNGLALDLSGGGTVVISDHSMATFNTAWIVG